MGGRAKPNKNTDKSKGNSSQTQKPNSSMLADSNTDPIASLRTGMEGISKQIQALQNELKADIKSFKEEITTQVKREMSDLKADIDQKFATVSNDIQEQNEKIDAILTRTEEVEAWSSEANTVLLEVLREQSKTRDKLEDLEARSRRNNLRIYGIPKDTEKGQTLAFVKEWLSTELSIDTDLQIQRAHRALAAKPKADKPPRGKKTYENAQEAVAELRRRGIEVDNLTRESTGVSLLERLQSTEVSSWHRVEGGRVAAVASRRAKQKLQEFQHNSRGRGHTEKD
ncbi:hypothetical protein D5F01_LYC23666 [Larimichthys crocea]|uniref:LINE-1 type transposase domain-containing protein 1 n=1 Tax=Larimichthys crocea TaxID=215358 RepID=A0A6G0HI74_LARCR|nr:hypothetical protein D5F01_LYC23666 [Larimichthys crocea]